MGQSRPSKCLKMVRMEADVGGCSRLKGAGRALSRFLGQDFRVEWLTVSPVLLTFRYSSIDIDSDSDSGISIESLKGKVK